MVCGACTNAKIITVHDAKKHEILQLYCGWPVLCVTGTIYYGNLYHGCNNKSYFCIQFSPNNEFIFLACEPIITLLHNNLFCAIMKLIKKKSGNIVIFNRK